MPELPEVETIRRGLEREVVGKKVKEVAVSGTRATRRQSSKKQFVTRLDAVKITGVERRGTFLILKLDTGDVLVVELGATGLLLRSAPKEVVTKSTHVVVTFTQGGQLRLLDPKGAAEAFVATAEELPTVAPELASLGIDPVEEPMSWQTFGHLLLRHPVKLKAFLTDQTILAGIGPVYSDEILFAAGLRYDRTGDSLSSQEMRRLYRAVVETLHDAIKYGGSSLAEDSYVDLAGKPGEFQEHLKVYDREKQACRRCRASIVKTKFAGRTIYLCEQCQV